MVQAIGYYLQYSIVLISFWTDTFGQLRDGEGRADQAAATWWMDSWTVFYMAWWTAWSGFVGIFIARISKGRTIMEVCMYGTWKACACVRQCSDGVALFVCLLNLLSVNASF